MEKGVIYLKVIIYNNYIYIYRENPPSKITSPPSLFIKTLFGMFEYYRINLQLILHSF
jgi:hypothetical protein